MSGLKGGSNGVIRKAVLLAKQQASTQYTGIDPKSRQGTNRGGSQPPAPGGRGRRPFGGIGPTRTPLSVGRPRRMGGVG